MELLEKLGYSKTQSDIYNCLLGEENLSVGKIAKKVNFDRVTIYKALTKLIEEGLVSFSIKSKRRTFKAANPEKILSIIQGQKIKLANIENEIPSLITKFLTRRQEMQSDFYEGVKGLKTLAEKFLSEARSKDEWLVLGAPKKAEILGGYYKNLNERRAKKNVALKIIFNKNARSLYDVRKSQKLVKVRIMPKNYLTPSSIEILGDNVAIIIYSPAILVLHIKSIEVAKSFTQYFNLIWKNSKNIQ